MSGAGTREFEGVTIPEAGTFTLDPFHTRIGFSARHLMVSRVRGRFGEFTGSITIAENPFESSADAVIKTASVDTGVDMRDTDLKSEHFLNADKYPEMSFRTTGITGHDGSVFTVTGELTIQDHSHPIELTVELEGVTTRPEMMGGQQMIGFSMTGEINREEERPRRDPTMVVGPPPASQRFIAIPRSTAPTMIVVDGNLHLHSIHHDHRVGLPAPQLSRSAAEGSPAFAGRAPPGSSAPLVSASPSSCASVPSSGAADEPPSAISVITDPPGVSAETPACSARTAAPTETAETAAFSVGPAGGGWTMTSGPTFPRVRNR